MSKIAKVVDVTNCRTIADMLEKSTTDWDVVETDAGGGFTRLSRPDLNLPMAYVGGRFRTNNHRNQLHSLQTLLDCGDIIPASVAMWDNGAILAFQFRCPKLDVRIHDADIVSPLLTTIYSYGSQVADSAFFADFRAVCKNQFGKVASLNGDSRVKHRGNVHGKFAEILQTRISELGGELTGRYEVMRRMTARPIRGRELGSYFAEAIGATPEELQLAWGSDPSELKGSPLKLTEIAKCYREDDAGAPGTVWQALNAVTRYETHHDGRNEASRTRRMLLGAGDVVAQNAFTMAARLAA